eukprot:337153_1
MMLSKSELLKHFANIEAEKLKQQLIAAISCTDNKNQEALKFLNTVHLASKNYFSQCYSIKPIIETCIDNKSFSIDLVFLIYSFIISIPTQSLLFHLDFGNYDSMNFIYDQKTNKHYLQSIKSLSLENNIYNNDNTNIIFKSLNNHCPMLNFKDGYVHFDNKQILVSQNTFNLYNNNGVTIIIVFRCNNVENNNNQQFLLNFGSGYATNFTNMEIGVNAGCDPDYKWDKKIASYFGVHSGRGVALTSFDEKYKIKNNKWYLYTMILKSNTNIEFYINGSNIATNTIYQWKGYNNNTCAPFDIGGRIDGNWVPNSVYAHNKIYSNNTHCNCHFDGDIGTIIVYDRIITLKEKTTIETHLLRRFK